MMAVSGGHGGISLFGVASFVVGVVSLAGLVIRRGDRKPLAWLDYAMMFIGIAGAITGLAVLFLRFE
jgi:hypothetical protein